MNDSVRWLLGLKTLLPDQQGVEFGFEHPLPAWGWALVALAAFVLAFLSYRRIEGHPAGRAFLGLCRAALLLLLAVLLSGPRLLKPNETEEKDWVLVLVDRSASLTVPDAPTSSPPRETREAQLRAALAQSRDVWSALGAERVVVWLGFDAGAYELPVPAAGQPGPPTLDEPAGRRTDLSRALDQALKRAAARPLSGVVVLSDGRSIDEPGRAILRTLDAQKVPVFTVALGSAKGLTDISVKRVEAPRSAFTLDTIPVQVELERTGPAARPGESAIVELVDTATDTVLDSRTLDWSDAQSPPAPDSGGAPALAPPAHSRITLTARPALAGVGKWLVRVKPADPTDALAGDMIESNNSAPLAIELVDRPLRIAYFDGYPRWEYRYLKNLLVRERSFSSAVMLLAPGRKYLQEGSLTLDSLPRSPEDWARFDVIILGDLWPGVFSTEQLDHLKQRIALGGAGLIWIGGEGPTPAQWRATPLADLLPFSATETTSSSGRAVVPTFEGAPLLMRPTPAADRLGVLRLSQTQTGGSFWPPALSDPDAGWSILRWAQRIDPALLKPTAETLALIAPADDDARASPAVISMRFGAGRALYVATDDIWRWRYGQGERLPERFWVQLIRLLGRESLARSERAALLEVSPERAQVAQPIRIGLTLLDQALVDSAPPSLRVRIRRPLAGASLDQAVSELALAPEGATAASRPGAARTYSSIWVPSEPGRYTAEVIDPAILGRALGDQAAGGLSAPFEVFQPDDELRQPQADHALLARLSQTTGGRVLTPDQLSELPRLLPNRRLRLAGEPDIQTLWDSPLALILFIALLTIEWIGRRLIRLV